MESSSIDRKLSADAMWAIPVVGAPAPLPGGDAVVVPVKTWSMAANSGRTRLWLIPGPGASGEPRPLTAAETSSEQPKVSPDGARLAFVRKPGGEPSKQDGDGRPRHPDRNQLYVMRLDGGEPTRVTDLPLGVCDPRWFPDGRRIAFLAEVYRDALTPEAAAERKKSRDEDPVQAYVTENRVYRYWDRWLTDDKVHHIFALDLETEDLVDLTPDWTRWLGLFDPTDVYRIAPDGSEIAFSAVRTNPPYDELRYGVFVVGVTDSATAGTQPPPRLITAELEGHQTRPIYVGPTSLVYGLQREIDFYADKTRLVYHDLETGMYRVLTEDWDGSAEGWAVTADGATLVFAAEHEGRRLLHALALHSDSPPRDGHAGDVREVDDGMAPVQRLDDIGWYGDPHLAGEWAFATHQSLSAPPEVKSVPLDDLRSGVEVEPTRLSEFTRDALADITLGAVESVTFEGHAGRDVQMFLVFPPGVPPPAADEAPEMPLVHMIHGGPHGVFGDAWHARWNAQAFAAPGYLVALVNFHGSTGWGQDYTASILGRWGDQPYHDIMLATDHLIARGLVDSKRMAIAGGSYGGYLVAWIVSQTDRFSCAVNHAGVSDFQTQYATDVTQGRQRSMGGEPWENIEGMDAFNPFRQARGFATPMLVIHGQKDYRVPYAQGLALYNVYKAMGLPARLVVYPEENHWILTPRNSRHWYGEVLTWLERWLGTP